MKISIFTPTHDSRWLPDAYNSIKDQDFFEWVIVYNNGGVPVKFNDERVKSHILYKSPEYVGALKAYACEQCTGDILLELDHDDWLTPNAIEEVKKAFEDPETGFVYSNAYYPLSHHFSEEYGWKYGEKTSEWEEHISFSPTPEMVTKIWFSPDHIRACRADVYKKTGGHSKEMRVLDDMDLMCRMYIETKFYHINKPLYYYRVHGENTWLKHNKEIQDNVFRLYEKYIDDVVTVWADRKNLLKIELGGGNLVRKGYINIDERTGDIKCNLNDRWPLEDNSVGVIRALDILEHLSDPVHAMKEIQRVLVPGGWLLARVPSTDGRGAFQDPTHKSFWNENSFLYYTDRDIAKYIDCPVRFQAAMVYTTKKDKKQNCWTIAHLINLKDNYRPCGLVKI